MAEEAKDEAVTINPFKLINRGEDTLGPDDEVQFADFSPKIVPADTPDEVEPAPKERSAPEPVQSQDSPATDEQKKSETTVPAPAEKGGGKPSQNETGKQASS